MNHKVYTLNVIGVDEERNAFVTEYAGQKNLVKRFRFQEEIPAPSTVFCVNISKNAYVNLFQQDLYSTIADLYTVGQQYSFTINDVKINTADNSYTVFLSDSYYFEHKYISKDEMLMYSRGKKCICTVANVQEDGTLVLEGCNIQDEQKQAKKAKVISDEERKLFDKLRRKNLNAKKVLVDDQDYSGLWSTVIEKYPDKAHFVYELLQNADDVKATKVEFYLKEDGLIFKHNGTIPFSISDPEAKGPRGHINAITGIARSTKDDMSNTIGKFGLGFKAVFSYTERPEIYEDKFKFAIESYIVPVFLDKDHPMRKTGETLFYFPFKHPEAAYDDIAAKLQTMKNPNLFLRNIESIEWQSYLGDYGNFSKSTISSFNKVGLKCEKLEVKNCDKSYRLWLFSKNVVLKGHGIHTVSVGYPLNDDGTINTNYKGPIYCFFPTSEHLNLCCICHAPFLLTDNRQNVTDSKENAILTNALADVAAKALLALRDEKDDEGGLLLDDNIYDIIPLEEDWYSGTVDINEFFEAYKEIIKKEALLFSRSSKYLKIKDAKVAPNTAIADLLNRGRLNALLKNKDDVADFIAVGTSQNSSIYDYLVAELEIDTFSYQELARLLTPEFMSDQPQEWISTLYNSILENAKQQLKQPGKMSECSMRKAPIFKNNKGEWVAPYIGKNLDIPNIFRPSPQLEEGQNAIDANLYSMKSCKAILDYLEIAEPKLFDKVKISLDKYNDNDAISRDVMVADFKLFLSCFLQTEDYEERNELKEKLANCQAFAIKDRNGKSIRVKPGSFYIHNPILDRYLKGNKSSNFNFFDEKYYESVYKGYVASVINDFLQFLGAKKFPGIKKREVSYNDLTTTQKTAVSKTCYTSWKEAYDFDLPGLGFAAKNGNIDMEISKLLWNTICNYGVHNIKFTFRYFYRTDKFITADSALIDKLKELPWLCNKDGKIVPPNGVTIESLKDSGYPYNEQLCEILGIEHDSSDIISLGASQEQQDIYDKGRLLDGYTQEEVKALVAKDKAEKQRLADEEASRKEREERKQRLKENSTASKQTNADRKALADSTMQDMFSTRSLIPSEAIETKPEEASGHSSDEEFAKALAEQAAARREEIAQKLEEDKENKLKIEDLKSSVDLKEKYSMDWFSTLMRIEQNAIDDDSFQNSSSITISFSSVSKEPGTERIFVLKNPSRLIPMELEEIGGLNITFTFTNKDSFSQKFEVACVRNFSLLVKANQDDVISLSKIDWRQCTKAEISINNISDLEKRLITAFEGLDYEPNYNIKEHLGDNISFVFGPPGTGKTTYLAKKITEILSTENAKILVLAPTNKACDVIAEKLLAIDQNNYTRIGRFVATASSEIEENGLLVNREDDFLKKDACCLVSTIARLPYDGFEDKKEDWSLRNFKWDYVIIDEASMIHIAQISYALCKFSQTSIIIAGDPLQIAPIAKDEHWKQENIYTMINLLTFDNPKTEPRQFDIVFLDTQYRSLPAIGNLFSRYAYKGLVKSYRKSDSQMPLNVDGFNFKPINFMPFRVDKFDSLYGAKKLNNSNIHIYSALLVEEFTKYISLQYAQNTPDIELSVGVICPYAPQAHLINNLILQQRGIPENVKITVGTIHGFQGDECDIILAVFNPPTGLKTRFKDVLVNNKNIINVAISRAKDYLFVFMPSSETADYDKLIQLNNLGSIASIEQSQTAVFNSDVIEQKIFGSRLYLENHSFVTSHQLTNIYTEAQAKYEIRIDNSAIDVQIDEKL